MKIDWFTVIAQIINFLVLMWLLKRFLYQPILSSIDERETNIKNKLLDAESQKKEAAQAKEEFNHKNETFNKEKDELMKKTVAEAKTEGDKLKENARNEANELKDRLEKAFAEDQAIKNNNMAKRLKGEVLDIARKTLTDLSSVSLEGQTVDVFLKKINDLQAQEKAKFSEALKGGKPVLVQSAFALSANQQGSIQKTISGLLKTENTYEFKTRPELITGIEVLTNGYKLSWSVTDYLKSFEEDIEVDKKVEIEAKE
ncbi:F0F1 ATP synthase subunit B [Zobellia nedashkovskayae]|uniref:F0F1 ATP synthase subunit B family protein n=1 Tax=Zobellia nedashkovskayae TaxID=2779510 RepID=UPI00188A464B|nr:F0F1 ATP synthase subunit B [Zobellia nedashkovskayae]